MSRILRLLNGLVVIKHDSLVKSRDQRLRSKDNFPRAVRVLPWQLHENAYISMACLGAG